MFGIAPLSHGVNPKPVAAAGKWQIDQFQLQSLPSLVVYKRQRVMDFLVIRRHILNPKTGETGGSFLPPALFPRNGCNVTLPTCTCACSDLTNHFDRLIHENLLWNEETLRAPHQVFRATGKTLSAAEKTFRPRNKSVVDINKA